MKGYKPSSKALEMVKIAFYRACRYDKFITLHIDDGRLGGGTSIPHDDEMTFDEWTNYYNTYFVNENTDRVGIFHHCIMVNLFKGKYWGKETSDWWGAGEYDGDRFAVNKKARSASEQAHFFMHELGHGIHLIPNVFDGIDSDGYSFSEYQSCMNYNSPNDYVDYSHGGVFNDWANLDLTAFQQGGTS